MNFLNENKLVKLPSRKRDFKNKWVYIMKIGSLTPRSRVSFKEGRGSNQKESGGKEEMILFPSLFLGGFGKKRREDKGRSFLLN